MALTGVVSYAGVHAPRQRRSPWGAWESWAIVLVVGDTSRDRRVILRDPLTWAFPNGTTITVPEGWTSDGATIPRSVWWLMGGRLNLDYLRAALLHDWYCSHQHLIGSNTLAAEVFYCGLRADGMGFNRARLCYHGVNRFGPQWAPNFSGEPDGNE